MISTFKGLVYLLDLGVTLAPVERYMRNDQAVLYYAIPLVESKSVAYYIFLLNNQWWCETRITPYCRGTAVLDNLLKDQWLKSSLAGLPVGGAAHADSVRALRTKLISPQWHC